MVATLLLGHILVYFYRPDSGQIIFIFFHFGEINTDRLHNNPSYLFINYSAIYHFAGTRKVELHLSTFLLDFL